jgi:hypothetical protein
MAFPPSKRGQSNITRDLMMDLSREAAAMPEYHRETNPHGMVDLTSSINNIMQEEIQSYIASMNLQPENCIFPQPYTRMNVQHR